MLSDEAWNERLPLRSFHHNPTMSLQSQLPELRGVVAPDCDILTDPAETRFHELAKRWADTEGQIPGAIVLPRTEEDIQTIVSWAIRSSIPFVPKCGGHSSWSILSSDGIVIDLSQCSAVEVDAEAQTATIKGGILQKEVAVRLAEAGLFTGKL